MGRHPLSAGVKTAEESGTTLLFAISHWHDAASGRVRRANAHGRGREEALDGVARVGGNRSH
eukprot:416251-Rhodomonas_salina.1